MELKEVVIAVTLLAFLVYALRVRSRMVPGVY